MTTYLVHVPAEAERGQPDGLDRAVLVKDGFHWLALVFPVLWLLYHRAWIALLVFLAASVALMAVVALGDLPGGTLVAGELLLGLALAVAAPDLRGWTLGRRGYRLADVVAGEDEELASRRFFERWLAGAPPASRGRPAAAVPGGTAPQVLGLFPEAPRP
ncbi:DUF2628 domain-containing protein [Alsobacter sp. R-9]